MAMALALSAFVSPTAAHPFTPAPGVTELVSVSSSAAQQGGDGSWTVGDISGDGSLVVFDSPSTKLVPDDTNRAMDVFLRDRMRSEASRVSLGPRGRQANGDSQTLSITSDGRYVLFTSEADNLVAHDTNRNTDVFLRDLLLSRTIRVGLKDGGRQRNYGS